MRPTIRHHIFTATMLASLLVLGVGCTTTQKAPIKAAGPSGFIDYARLTPGTGDQLAMRYVNTNARWTSYKKIIIDPVTFWAGDDTSVSPADQQALCDYFHAALVSAIGQKLTITDTPGPGVMRLAVAITDLSSATPVLRTISVVVPQARALNTLKYAATGTYAFIGGAQGEAKLTDASTGATLGAWIDRRVGGGSLDTAVQWQWGDAENAMDKWSDIAATRLAAWTSGTEKP